MPKASLATSMFGPHSLHAKKSRFRRQTVSTSSSTFAHSSAKAACFALKRAQHGSTRTMRKMSKLCPLAAIVMSLSACWWGRAVSLFDAASTASASAAHAAD